MIATERARWKAAQDWLARLLALPAEARQAALEEARLEPELHRRVARLLAAVAAPDPRLELGSGGLVADPEPPNRLAGRHVGDWELLEEIGRGGMSVVYRARRHGPGYEQFAAVKLLGLASLGSGGAARFEQERRVLASLRHPHIAALVDGGVAEDHTPWLAMQLVDGEHIDGYCDRHDLPLAARVALVVQICEAVAHAHRSLVVHRDIKPANILVTDAGVPVLVDFGIAKLLGEDTEATRTGLRALTPGYAAPEQAAGEAITTATDVYALGAVLERVAAGCAPLPTDLRNVIGMAKREDPERRYHDAIALAADLQRWLERRPVQATPDSLGYRMHLLLRRRRGVVIASAAAVLLLLAGVAATLWQAERATRQATRAEASRDFLVDLFRAADPQASGREATLAGVVDVGLQRIDGAFSDAPLLYAEMAMLLGGLRMIDGDHAGAGETLQRALQAADGDPALRARILLRMGQLASLRGEPKSAIEAFEQAIDADPTLRADVVPSLALALQNSGQEQRAAALTREALDTLAGAPGTSAHQRAQLLIAAAEYSAEPDQQLAMLQQASDWLDRGTPTPYQRMTLDANLANAHRRAGQLQQAVAALQDAADAAHAIYDGPSIQTARIHNNLGGVLRKAGRVPEAVAAFAAAEQAFRALGDTGSPAFAALLNNRATLLRDMGREAEAIPLLEEALVLAERHFGGDAWRTGIVFSSLARARAETGDPRAEPDWQRARDIAAAQGKADSLASRLISGALVALALGDDDAALARVAEAEATFGQAAGSDWQDAVVAAHIRAALAQRRGALDEACTHYQQAIARIAAQGNGSWGIAWRLHRDYGDFLRQAHEPEAAAVQYRQSLAVLSERGLDAREPAYEALQARLQAVERDAGKSADPVVRARAAGATPSLACRGIAVSALARPCRAAPGAGTASSG